MTQGGFFSGANMDPEEMARIMRESLTPRDYARQLLRHTNIEAQLEAIKRTIESHEQEREAEGYQFEVLDTDPRWDGDYDGGLEALRHERHDTLTYQYSAHSMAAVGMLAPFIESLFVAIFNGLKDRVTLPPESRRHTLDEKNVWNPQWYAARKSKGNRKNILLGINQMTDATGLKTFLPLDHEIALDALVAYRNNMFHNGFEWPDCPGRFDLKQCPELEKLCDSPRECKRSKVQKFTNCVGKEGWPKGWFELAERNGKPWLVYMTPEFCAHCVDLIDGIIEGTGRYLKERGV